MARSKKADDKSKEGTLSIDVDSFIRMRDSVVTQLATLQEHCRTISSGYIKYTSAVLGEHDGGDGESALRLGENAILSGLGSLGGPGGVAPAMGEPKVHKKKRAHDPNAPKRPLTPYFLYMQTARPIIAEDLGPDVAKGAVSAEGVRRWNAMEGKDKQLWTIAYTDNLRLYNARVHSYKNGNLNAKDMSDEDAMGYADLHNIQGNFNEPTADGQLTSEALLDPAVAVAIEEDEDEEPEAPKSTPKAKSRGKPSKPGKAPTPASIVPPASSAIVPPSAKPSVAAPPEVEKEKSPDKKRKRSSKAAKEAEAEEAAAAAAAAAETPKTGEKKPRKKKSKSDA